MTESDILFRIYRLTDQLPKFRARVMVKDLETDPSVNEVTKVVSAQGSGKTLSQVLSSCSISGGIKLRPFSGARVPS